VSDELSTQLIDAAGLRAPLAEICAIQEEHQRFFSGVFSALDRLASELSQRQETWLSERKLSAEALQRQAATIGANGDGQLQRILEEAERGRDVLRTALEATETHGQRLAQMTDELSQARAELAGARQEIERLRGDLDKAPSPAVPDEKLQERLQQAERERDQIDRERVVLETELDTVRHRAAEMTETLADQRREIGEERKQWALELKRMRSLLEALSKRPTVLPAAASGPPQSAVDVNKAAPPAAPATVSASAAGPDPVLESVAAQFEMLQKDVVRRRETTADCN